MAAPKGNKAAAANSADRKAAGSGYTAKAELHASDELGEKVVVAPGQAIPKGLFEKGELDAFVDRGYALKGEDVADAADAE